VTLIGKKKFPIWRQSELHPGEEKKRKKKKASLSVLPQRIRRHTDTHVIQIYIIHVKT